MQKTTTAIVAAASLAATVIAAPKPAEARCIGCWVGAGIAAAVIGGVFASRAYGYGYGYPAYGYGGYGGYGYPAYNYGYGLSGVQLRVRISGVQLCLLAGRVPPVLRAAPLLCTPVLSLLIRGAGGIRSAQIQARRYSPRAVLPAAGRRLRGDALSTPWDGISQGKLGLLHPRPSPGLPGFPLCDRD